jgi:hypothetical protein
MGILLTGIQRLAVVLCIGLCLIIYVALGIIIIQQLPKQEELQRQIDKTMDIVSKPLPDITKLQAEYDAANAALVPLTVEETLAIIVDIAENNGIDVEPSAGKLNIPPPARSVERKIGEGTYYVRSFNQITVEGNHDSVMAFIDDLDLGKTKEIIILKSADVAKREIRFSGDEANRRAEFHLIAEAVAEMMADNGLLEIPSSLSATGGNATSDMRAFPDTLTTVAAKGYSGTGEVKDGYTLVQHDRISTDNSAEFQMVNYIDLTTSVYYYTCEADGTVRQYDGPDVAVAAEFFGSEAVVPETVAVLNIDLYSKATNSG